MALSGISVISLSSRKSYLACLLAFVGAAITATHMAFYVNKATLNVLYQDDIRETQFVQSISEGKVSLLRVLWMPDNIVFRTPLGRLMTLANVKLFHWNAQYELYSGAFYSAIIVAVSILILSQCVRNDQFYSFSVILGALIITFIASSLTDWENHVFNAGVYQLLQAASFISTAALLSQAVQKPSSMRLLVYALATVWSILFATSIYSVAFGFASVVVLFGLVTLRLVDKKIIAMLIGLNVSSLAIYLFGINLGSGANKIPFVELFVLRARIFLEVFTAGLLHNEKISGPAGPIFQCAVGLFIIGMLITTTLALLRHCKENKALVAPLLLMTYSIVVAAMIAYGRTMFGAEAGLASRYASQTQLGLIGLVVATLFIRGRSSPVIRQTLLLLLSFILVSSVLSNRSEWRIAPYRHENYKKLESMTLTPQLFPDKDFQMFQDGTTPADIAAIKGAINIWRAYRLGPYGSIGHTLASATLLSGWYGWEGNQIWMGKESEAYFLTGPLGEMSLSAYLPAPYIPNGITLFIDGRRLKKYKIKTNQIQINAEGLPQNSIVKLKILVDKSFVPLKIGRGSDSRELGLLISNITFL